jgi:hypothetical protein
LKGYGEIFVETGLSSAAEIMGGGFCTGGTGCAGAEVLGFAHDFVSQRARVGELDGRDPAPLRGGTVEARDVSASEIF